MYTTLPTTFKTQQNNSVYLHPLFLTKLRKQYLNMHYLTSQAEQQYSIFSPPLATREKKTVIIEQNLHPPPQVRTQYSEMHPLLEFTSKAEQYCRVFLFH